MLPAPIPKTVWLKEDWISLYHDITITDRRSDYLQWMENVSIAELKAQLKHKVRSTMGGFKSLSWVTGADRSSMDDVITDWQRSGECSNNKWNPLIQSTSNYICVISEDPGKCRWNTQLVQLKCNQKDNYKNVFTACVNEQVFTEGIVITTIWSNNMSTFCYTGLKSWCLMRRMIENIFGTIQKMLQ